MLKETQLSHLIFGIMMVGYLVVGVLNRSYERNGDILFSYADRAFAAAYDYAAASSSTLRQRPSVALPASVLEGTRHGTGLGTWAPNGQTLRLYSYGNGVNATLYVVIPGGGTYTPFGRALYLHVANRMGVRAGTVEGAIIRSRAGGWGPVPLASLPGFAANDGDLVLRMQTLVRGT